MKILLFITFSCVLVFMIISIIISYIPYQILIRDKITITYKQFMALYRINPKAWDKASIHDLVYFNYDFIIYKNRRPEEKELYGFYSINKAIYFNSWLTKQRVRAYFKRQTKNCKKEQVLKEKAILVEFWNNDIKLAYKEANEALEKAKKQYQEITERMEKEKT